MKFLLSFLMLIASIFVASSVCAGVIDGPFLVEDQLVMSSDVLVFSEVDEASIMVVPASMPDHLIFRVDTHFKTAARIGATWTMSTDKGGFQDVEIVRLGKFRAPLIPEKSYQVLGLSVSNPLIL